MIENFSEFAQRTPAKVGREAPLRRLVAFLASPGAIVLPSCWQRLLGGVEVESDLPRRRVMRIKEQSPGSRGALTGREHVLCSAGREFAGEDRQHRVVAKPVAIEQVLVTGAITR